MSDHELLAAFAQTKSQDVFAEIVKRHLDRVYTACLRYLGEAHAAEDAAQIAFLVLSQKAAALPPDTPLGAWLYATALNGARKYRQAALSRSRREKEAAMMRVQEPRSESAWETIKPHVDQALARLPARQRDAIVMCYLYGMTQSDAAAQLRCSEYTVRSRVRYGLEKLRQQLGRHSVALSASALALLLTEHSSVAAPSHLAHAVCQVCAGQAAAAPVVLATAAKVQAYSVAALKGAVLALAAATALTGFHFGWFCFTPAPATPVTEQRAAPAVVPALPQASVSAWPDGTNTGYTHAPGYPGKLTPWGGGKLASGTTYSFLDFPGGIRVGSGRNPLTQVAFVGCRFHGAPADDALVILCGDDISFDYCSFEPDAQGPGPVSFDVSYHCGIAANGLRHSKVGKLTVAHCDFWGWTHATDVTPGNDPSRPHVYRDNYIHDAARVDGHRVGQDGIGSEQLDSAGAYVTIEHNTIESLANTQAIAFQGPGPYAHFKIRNNLLGGFGFTVSVAGAAEDIEFTGNTFSTRLRNRWGPLYGRDFWTKPGSVWRENKWLVPADAAWGNPAHNGWYWVPAAAETQSKGDTPYVSQNDYAPVNIRR